MRIFVKFKKNLLVQYGIEERILRRKGQSEKPSESLP
jgi:hypothetical protein